MFKGYIKRNIYNSDIKQEFSKHLKYKKVKVITIIGLKSFFQTFFQENIISPETYTKWASGFSTSWYSSSIIQSKFTHECKVVQANRLLKRNGVDFEP